jgi:hypothetical protein
MVAGAHHRRRRLVHIDEDGEPVDRLTFHCGTGKLD